jgi:dephospho-CoA kinase
MDKVTSDIAKGTELKKVETKDSSAPVIDPEAKMKTVDLPALVSGVTNPPELKRTETKDSSAPQVGGASVGKVDRVAQQQTIKQGAVTRAIEGHHGKTLKDTEVHDKSAPVIDPETKVKTVDRPALVSGVTNPPELKKAETKDSSAPQVGGASVGKVDRVAQQQVIKHGAVARSIEGYRGAEPLKDTKEIHDTSAPVIDAGSKVKTVDRPAILSGLENPPGLKKAETKDSSAPQVEGASVGKVDRVAQQQVIKHGAVARSIEGYRGAEPLKDTKEVHDTSAPVIDPDVKVKTVDRPALVSGVTNPPELKKATDVKDSSAPVIPPDATLRECDRVKMCIGIETASMKKK